MAGIGVFWNAPKKKRGPELVFGSKMERKMFPMHSDPTRLGIEQGLRGDPYRGPGCYGPDPSTLFLQAMDDRLKNHKGCGFSMSGTQRTIFEAKGKMPGPADYQSLPSLCRPSGKRGFFLPFSTASTRFPTCSKRSEHLGPGSHDHDVLRQRHVMYEESFGGPRTLKGPVPVKCTLGIPDKCKRCEVELIGDYYTNSKHTICRACYNQLSSPTRRCVSTVGVARRGVSTGGVVRGGKIRRNTTRESTSAEDTPGGGDTSKGDKGDVQEKREGGIEENRQGVGTVLNICVTNMRKIRDCSSIHRHEFPGTTPKTIIMSDKEQRKRALKEAYMKLYF